jgi:CRP-like cAMP-binding protein
VLKDAGAADEFVLARLGGGDIFGEMSLVSAEPTTATVRAEGPCSLLFLERGYVERLAAAIPEIQAYFESVAERRARDNTLRLGARLTQDEVTELQPDDLVLL